MSYLCSPMLRASKNLGHYQAFMRGKYQRKMPVLWLIYLALPNVGMSKMRVAERVAHGGHNIPLRDIERRFSRSLVNLLNVFSHKVDRCTCFMNDGEKPIPMFEQKGDSRDILHEVYYQQLLKSITE